jgi:thiosulfate dehydrogenase
MLRTATRAALALILAGVGLASIVRAQTPAPWPNPNPDTMPAGLLKDTVLYGRKVFNETYAVVGPEVADRAMRYAGNNLSCKNCHLGGGTQKFAIPMIGVYGMFPADMARENDVRTLEDRIQGCMERSMNGRSLPVTGKEMKGLVAYIQFLSRDIPVGKAPEGRGTPPLPPMARAADPKRGQQVFHDYCEECHQADGKGMRNGAAGDAKGYMYPPLWGPDSFNDGAGMNRVITSSAFIHANMPFGTHYDQPQVTAEDAWDVAAYINSQDRPKMSNLDRDYPNRARKPVDAAFPPYADNFPAAQHKYGPFQPLIDAQRARATSGR